MRLRDFKCSTAKSEMMIMVMMMVMMIQTLAILARSSRTGGKTQMAGNLNLSRSIVLPWTF